MASWGFYGRRAELAEIQRLLDKRGFFFCAISGRRRIGKTSLIQEALRTRQGPSKAIYAQIPDSDERGVIQVFEDAVEDVLRDQQFAREVCSSFLDISQLMHVLWSNNYITAIDEFQYFHRKSLYEFLSYLQASIDDARRDQISGGLIALGSIHTEMTAVLEDKSSPLFNRVTDRIKVGHWDFETLFQMFREHDIKSARHKLFLWSMFEGVPKFYRDCFDHGVLQGGSDHRTRTLQRMFFEGSSPLKDEAENWFLRELRGRYDSVLKLVARTGPCSHGSLKAEYDRTGPGGEKQLMAYLNTLIEKYQMIEKLNPIFSSEKGRKARYTISDNFLSAWLSSIARNVQFARIRPINLAVGRADVSLRVHEGYMFEKMVRLLIQECSQKNVGDFELTELVRGYWNKADGTDIEIDVVAVDETRKIIRLGSCKRSPAKHNSASLRQFNEHITRMTKTEMGRRYADWTVERALYSPFFKRAQKKALTDKGYRCYDLRDFERYLFV